jgi:hypothetical protein
VGRLQALLQSRNYRNDPNNNNDDGLNFFVFDFSSNDSLNDPANMALVYLAKEVAAVMGVPPKEDGVAFATENPREDNVVVTIGDETIAPTVDPDFYPILLKHYDDDQLVQRFALLSLQFASASSEISNPYAGGEQQQQQQPITSTSGSASGSLLEPMLRIVWTGQELDDASSNNNPPPSQADPKNPSSLADPKDFRFLVDECDWPGIECVPADNTTATKTIVTKIRWDYKNLDGTISPTIALLKNLVQLDMSNNNLQGTIPESLYELTDLEELTLFKNELVGTLSTMIGKLDKLTRLHLSHNKFTGALPNELKSDGGSEEGIRPIEYFNVYSNQFTGSIPADLRWRQCVHFDVGRNQLTGTLPDDLGEKFVALRHLYLDHNTFSGTFPRTYNTVGNGRLVMLAIENNQLSGVVPGRRDSYDNLVQYTLQNNNFVRLERENCENFYLVEFKADCPNVCTCFGGFFQFCERYCGSLNNNNNNNNGPQQWQRPPPRNWSF